MVEKDLRIHSIFEPVSLIRLDSIIQVAKWCGGLRLGHESCRRRRFQPRFALTPLQCAPAAEDLHLLFLLCLGPLGFEVR